MAICPAVRLQPCLAPRRPALHARSPLPVRVKRQVQRCQKSSLSALVMICTATSANAALAPLHWQLEGHSVQVNHEHRDPDQLIQVKRLNEVIIERPQLKLAVDAIVDHFLVNEDG